MAIATMDALIAALPGQHIHTFKTSAPSTTAGFWHTLFDRAGKPGAGNLTVGNTANGLIPTSATLGAVPFVNPTGGLKTYLGRLFGVNSVAGVLQLYDRLFHAGSYSTAALATTALATQPALTRGVTGEDNEIWLELNVAMGATATTVEVTYTNSQGVTGRTTGPQSINAFPTGRMVPMPLQAGDTGVQRIDSVIVGGAVGTGTFNVLIIKRLAEVSTLTPSVGLTLDALTVGMPEIEANACLAFAVLSNTTNGGTPVVTLDIITG